jgi:imidazoleglycerol phosphate synthase glutamine amidotransferase subunit HisH
MKKSELRKLIEEQVRAALSEGMTPEQLNSEAAGIKQAIEIGMQIVTDPNEKNKKRGLELMKSAIPRLKSLSDLLQRAIGAQ